MVDYSFERLSRYFRYDKASPSCVVTACDRYGGKNNKQVLVKAGCSVGSIEYGRDGLPAGWRVTIRKERFQAARVIWVLVHGDIHDSKMVIDHLDGNPLNNCVENLSLKTVTENNRNVKKSIRNTSGKVGVFFEADLRRGTDIVNVVATWREKDSTHRSRRFSVAEHGKDLAFELACLHRDKMLAALKEQGANYTSRHGT